MKKGGIWGDKDLTNKAGEKKREMILNPAK